MGLEPALLSGAPGLPAVQACIAAAQRCIEEGGGLLRQFILDDKGVVIIWTFGLPGSTHDRTVKVAVLEAPRLATTGQHRLHQAASGHTYACRYEDNPLRGLSTALAVNAARSW